MTHRTLIQFVTLLFCLLLALPAALGQDNPKRVGNFQVRSASTTLNDGVHELEARLQLILSGQALKALNSGVALTIELRVEVIRVRRFYLDDLEAELSFNYTLEYSPLGQRYIVRNVTSGDQESFATLYSALNHLGRIQGLPIIDDVLLKSDSNYRVRLRALLSTKQFAAPLRIIFFWRDQWQLKSEWFEWQLER
ncbi:MAG: DUF4390 domain-containing protein [Gammaproteobacteria bacterium]|nr:DUF4390 domain-containing protein [Gammaproteobacteria bacterium]